MRWGCQTAVSHQHSVRRSQPSSEDQRGQRSEVSLRDMRGPKYFQLEGHPNLFSHIHGAYQASRAHSVLCTKRGEWVVAAIWE